MCNYLHLQASFGSSVQITVTFCFELKFLRVQPCWSWSTLCQWRTGQKVLTLYTFCQWRAESPGTPYTFASEGQKVLAHFILLPVPTHLILLPHILAVLTLLLKPLILVIVIQTAERKMAALPFDHIHVFTTIKPQSLTKRMRNRVGLLTQVGWNDRSEN